MAGLQLNPADYSATKLKAIDDARQAQALIIRECADAGRQPPPFTLAELIGRGSFGRVYKARTAASDQFVAVKIISIEEGDASQPGTVDTFSDILKEVNTLKILSNSSARNINRIVDAFLVGQSVWMVTEYCAGGSVASLMRPTGGLPEKWVIPILREVAEAIFWVHKQGIIHRDIKCANVLVTDVGGVQLCDFGVASIMETKFDKRSTVTGTLHWMAPELFDSTVSYGMEVDIWAFGSMAYEIASGLPPNATAAIDLPHFGSFLKQFRPRLEGDEYSSQLKSLVSFCMVEDAARRPPIEQVQAHPYIFNTDHEYPTESLSKLVSAYRLWETQGWGRKSLFSAGGAQALVAEQCRGAGDEWTFDDGEVSGQPEGDDSKYAQEVYDAYFPDAGVCAQPTPSQPIRRRRRPPVIKALKGPLEKVFDPNTMTNYEDNARAFYGKRTASSSSDLPLRNNSEEPAVRESLIDLDAALGHSLKNSAPLRLADLETIKPSTRPLSSGSADADRRKTQDWTFPMTAPASAGPDMPRLDGASRSSPAGQDNLHPRGPLRHVHSDIYVPAARSNRASDMSLIDLDASLVLPPEVPRPSTADSCAAPFDSAAASQSHQDLDVNFSGFDASPADPSEVTRPSTAGSHTTSSSTAETAPFHLELEARALPSTDREPSLYVPDDMSVSIPSPTPYTPELGSGAEDEAGPACNLRLPSNNPARPTVPPLPTMPSTDVLQGLGSMLELKNELQIMISNLREHFLYATDCLEVAYNRQTDPT